MRWSILTLGLIAAATLVAGSSLALVDMVGAGAALAQDAANHALGSAGEGAAVAQQVVAYKVGAASAFAEGAAAPAFCAPMLAQAAASNAIFLKQGAESLALSAASDLVTEGSGALTDVVLDVPPQGPLNPATPGQVEWTAYGVAAGAGADAGAAFQNGLDGAFGPLAC
jgi:hypothetical protein